MSRGFQLTVCIGVEGDGIGAAGAVRRIREALHAEDGFEQAPLEEAVLEAVRLMLRPVAEEYTVGIHAEEFEITREVPIPSPPAGAQPRRRRKR